MHPPRRKPRGERFCEEDETANSSPIVSRGSDLFTFILVIFTLLIYDVIVISQKDALNVQFLTTDLLNSVHNQSEAVSVVIESLNKFNSDEKSMNVVNFIGGTGVGKTFIANILKKHFYPCVYEVTGENGRSEIKQTSCSDHSLIVVDDLTVDDVDNVVDLIKKIPQELGGLVVCIFNIQETDDNLNHIVNYDLIDKITDKFNKAEVAHHVGKFYEFDVSQASAWVTQQLISKGVNPKFHSDIVESVLNNHNIRYHGLKGLSTKINLKL